MSVTIARVAAKSPAARAHIRAGEQLLCLNGHRIEDVLDYRFYMLEATLSAAVSDGKKTRILHVHKEEYEDLGLEFDTYLMDKQRSCRNRCVFCFIDQLPPGLRETLYFKDDDSRLSFLFGNYITLTNLTEHEISRIIDMHISPIHISVHTTNPELRARMMGNRFAGESLQLLNRFAQAGVNIQCQLVLCPGYNDGAELERSMTDLAALYPSVTSVAAVPVGLTRYRQGLTPLRSFTREECRDVIRLMENKGAQMLAAHGTRVFYPSDEFYLCAELPIPPETFYGEMTQLENGVGMVALLCAQFREALAQETKVPAGTHMVIATGVSAAPFLQKLIDEAHEKWHTLCVEVIPVINHFFGEKITVAGLLTGRDLCEQLAGKKAQAVFIPADMLRREGDCFLDDVTPRELAAQLGMRVEVVPVDGAALLKAILQ